MDPPSIVASFPSTNSLSSTLRHSFVFAVSDVVKGKTSKSVATASNLLITKVECLEIYEDMVLGRSFEDVDSDVLYIVEVSESDRHSDEEGVHQRKGLFGGSGSSYQAYPHDTWLLITESRNGNAHYSAFHNLNARIGFQALIFAGCFRISLAAM